MTTVNSWELVVRAGNRLIGPQSTQSVIRDGLVSLEDEPTITHSNDIPLLTSSGHDSTYLNTSSNRNQTYSHLSTVE